MPNPPMLGVAASSGKIVGSEDKSINKEVVSNADAATNKSPVVVRRTIKLSSSDLNQHSSQKNNSLGKTTNKRTRLLLNPASMTSISHQAVGDDQKKYSSRVAA